MQIRVLGTGYFNRDLTERRIGQVLSDCGVEAGIETLPDWGECCRHGLGPTLGSHWTMSWCARDGSRGSGRSRSGPWMPWTDENGGPPATSKEQRAEFGDRPMASLPGPRKVANSL